MRKIQTNHAYWDSAIVATVEKKLVQTPERIHMVFEASQIYQIDIA
jgi:hypothetical protein